MSHDKVQKPAAQAHGAHGAHAGLTISERLFAGAVAGVVECLIMYPLDVVKTLQQLKVGKGAGTFTILFDLIKREKFGIYRGIIAPLLMEAPKRAIKFAAVRTGAVGFFYSSLFFFSFFFLLLSRSLSF
jgi:hypothetical protein